MVRVLVGSLLAAVVLFVWGSVWWMALPVAGWAMKPVPNEEAVSAALKTNLPESGVYFAPYCDQKATAEQQAALIERSKAGPLAEIIYHKEGVDATSPAYFAIGFAHMALAALLAGTLLSLAAPALRSYAGRAGFACLLGLFAAFTLNLSDIIWFHHPWQFPVMMAAFNASGWLLAALVLGAVIRPARPAPAVAVAHNGAAQQTARVHR